MKIIYYYFINYVLFIFINYFKLEIEKLISKCEGMIKNENTLMIELIVLFCKKNEKTTE